MTNRKVNIKFAILDPVTLRRRIFENAAWFLGQGQPSTTVHTNPSQKWSFSKTLFKPEQFENGAPAF